MMAPALARGEAQGGNDTFQTYQDYAGYGDSAGFAGNIYSSLLIVNSFPQI